MDGALVKPKLIRLKAKQVFLVMKAVLALSSGLIVIFKYSEVKPKVEIKLLLAILATFHI